MCGVLDVLTNRCIMINCKEDTKDTFDRLKPEGMNHDEFVAELLETYEHADEPVRIDSDKIADEIKESVASEVELSAFRGVTEAIEQHNE